MSVIWRPRRRTAVVVSGLVGMTSVGTRDIFHGLLVTYLPRIRCRASRISQVVSGFTRPSIVLEFMSKGQIVVETCQGL